MIKKTEVRTFINRVYCDECGAEMKVSPVVLDSFPPQYQYICPECGECLTLNVYYPCTEYEEV